MLLTERVPVRRLWFAILCGYLALGATLQQLPGYLVSRFDAGPFVVGTVVAIAFLGTAAARPYAGRAGDLGFSRDVAAVGSLVVVLAAVGHLLAPTIALLIVARLAMGVGEGMLFSATLPWVLTATPADRRGQVAGWFGLSMWSGLSVGPLLAGLAGHVGGDRAVWSLVIALPVCAAGLLLSIGRQGPSTQWRRIVSVDPRVLVPSGGGGPAVSLGLSAYGYGTLTALLILYLSTAKLGGEAVALSLYAAAFLIARTIGSPLVDRCGARPIAVGTLLIQATGLTVVALAASTPVVLIGVVLTGVGVGSIYPATSAMTLDRTTSTGPGVAMGTMTSLWDLGILIAGPVGGLLAAATGYRWVFVAAAGGALLACLAAALTKSPHRSPLPTRGA
ncbi:MFS transporter [Williamsia herbipolensis]|uniref:MFS transporter n=1 Tax=Williamsia herbipolensis TaxID=1603258 RepID=UPI0005F7B82A|nr:MFS transporter [Williamsia herbipolensis]